MKYLTIFTDKGQTGHQDKLPAVLIKKPIINPRGEEKETEISPKVVPKISAKTTPKIRPEISTKIASKISPDTATKISVETATKIAPKPKNAQKISPEISPMSAREKRMRKREECRGDGFPTTLFDESNDTILVVKHGKEGETWLGAAEEVPITPGEN